MNKEKSNKRNGFTLAELLITITIIGVVSVLILPAMISNIQKKNWNSMADLFEKKLEQSLRVMNTEGVISPYTTTEDFVDKLQKYYKISRICKNTELENCFVPQFATSDRKYIKQTKNFTKSTMLTADDWGTNVIGVQFGNGINAIMAYNPSCAGDPYNNTIPVLSCISMIYDVNGNNIPNENTKDIRSINGYGVDNFNVNGAIITKVAKAGEYQPIDCTDETSEDYKYCYGSTEYSTDYWAGAAKACGGKDNMANLNDLLKIAQYLYDDNSIPSNAIVTGLKRNVDKYIELQSYGFPNTKNYLIWSNSTLKKMYHDSADERQYFDTSTFINDNNHGNGHYFRSDANNIAVCTKH